MPLMSPGMCTSVPSSEIPKTCSSSTKERSRSFPMESPSTSQREHIFISSVSPVKRAIRIDNERPVVVDQGPRAAGAVRRVRRGLRGCSGHQSLGPPGFGFGSGGGSTPGRHLLSPPSYEAGALSPCPLACTLQSPVPFLSSPLRAHPRIRTGNLTALNGATLPIGLRGRSAVPPRNPPETGRDSVTLVTAQPSGGYPTATGLRKTRCLDRDWGSSG